MAVALPSEEPLHTVELIDTATEISKGDETNTVLLKLIHPLTSPTTTE